MPDILRTSPLAAGSPAGLADAAGGVSFEPITNIGCWQQLTALTDRAHSVQVFGYGEAKAANGWSVNRQLLSLNGRPVAIVQALEKRVLGIRIATRINRGPMLVEPGLSAAQITEIYRATRRHWARPYSPLLLAPALEETAANHAILKAAGFYQRNSNGWGSARLNLDQPIDDVFASFEHSWRKAIRAADKAGVTVEVVDGDTAHEWMIERHLQNMAEKGFSGHGADFLRALRRHSGSDAVLLQAFHAGNPVAGLLMLKFGDTADSIVAWFGPEGRQLKAGNAITWGAIKEMHRRGVRHYDVGGTNSDQGFSSFKKGMNGTPYRLLGEYLGF
jgi:peptidoglycan pentaglycine glycine transferase (the first glycine)